MTETLHQYSIFPSNSELKDIYIYEFLDNRDLKVATMPAQPYIKAITGC